MRDSRRRLPIWISIALALTTCRDLKDDNLTASDLSAIKQANDRGWKLRTAAPKWDLVWGEYAESLSAAKLIVLPMHGYGLSDEDYKSILRGRLSSIGLNTPAFKQSAWRLAEERFRYGHSQRWQRRNVDLE